MLWQPVQIRWYCLPYLLQCWYWPLVCHWDWFSKQERVSCKEKPPKLYEHIFTLYITSFKVRTCTHTISLPGEGNLGTVQRPLSCDTFVSVLIHPINADSCPLFALSHKMDYSYSKPQQSCTTYCETKRQCCPNTCIPGYFPHSMLYVT